MRNARKHLVIVLFLLLYPQSAVSQDFSKRECNLATLPPPTHQEIKKSMNKGKMYVNLHVPRSKKLKTFASITIKEVKIGSQKEGWYVFNDAPMEVSFSSLSKLETGIGGKILEPGTYENIILVMGDPNLLVRGKKQYPLQIDMQQSREIVIRGPFSIDAGEVVVIQLSFFGNKSIQKKHGDYVLKPIFKRRGIKRYIGFFASQNIKADEGGVIAASGGNMIKVPPNAVSQDTQFSMERIPNSSGGSIITDIFDIQPDDIEFSAPVFLRIPYNSKNIPSDSSECDLVQSINYEEKEDTLTDIKNNALGVFVKHF